MAQRRIQFRLRTLLIISAIAAILLSGYATWLWVMPNTDPFAEWRPAGDATFSADEQRLVAAARTYLQNLHGKHLDARYKVDCTRDGYEVHAMFVAGYENGRPLYSPGGSGIVVLRADGTVTGYMPGE